MLNTKSNNDNGKGGHLNFPLFKLDPRKILFSFTSNQFGENQTVLMGFFTNRDTICVVCIQQEYNLKSACITWQKGI